jgi:hypothetical protein
MSDDDDYLSDKFLSGAAQEVTTPQTYSQLRKDALKKAQERNVQNRTKSRRQRELESREEGLTKSLFEKAQEEDQAGLGSGNKALAMMVKMGFTPGQSLGRRHTSALTQPLETATDTHEPSIRKSPSPPRHKIEPLSISEWSGACLLLLSEDHN